MIREPVSDLGTFARLRACRSGLRRAFCRRSSFPVDHRLGRRGGAGAECFVIGLAAALVTLRVAFAPCFLLTFAVAPCVERITAQPRLNGALAGIAAAAVGVNLNLNLSLCWRQWQWQWQWPGGGLQTWESARFRLTPMCAAIQRDFNTKRARMGPVARPPRFAGV